jgi:DNA-binding XRE family transcriptional regulator
MRKLQSARIVSVNAESAMNVNVSYSDGRTVRINMRQLSDRLEVFSHLAYPQEFATAKVADFGWSLEWDCGATLDSDRVLEIFLEQEGMAENVRFRQWQDAHHLSLSEAAQAIGLTRRTISKYRTGSSPVPRYIALACKGWEAEQQGE